MLGPRRIRLAGLLGSGLAACLVVVTVLAGAGPTAATAIDGQPASTTAETLVVGDEGRFDEIQSALEAATEGDTIEVTDGTYAESVRVDANVTLVAPEGAVLDGSETPGAQGITIPPGSHAAPVIEGFTVRDFETGVVARESRGDWTLRDVRIVDAVAAGVDAAGSTGDWTLRGATVENVQVDGVDARQSTGDWTVAGTEILESGFDGVDATGSSGDWVVETTTVEGNGFAGTDAAGSTGDWRLRSVTVVDNGFGGVFAAGVSGPWSVRTSTLGRNSLAAIAAPGADVGGDASRNWWGRPAGPGPGDCFGNVSCVDPLAEEPGRALRVQHSLGNASAPAGESSPGAIRLHAGQPRARVGITATIDPPVDGTTVENVTFDSGTGTVVFEDGSGEKVLVALEDLSADAVVTVHYRIHVGEDAEPGSNRRVFGSVTSGDLTVDLRPETLRITPGDPVDLADRNDDGAISTSELRAAIADWASGRYTDDDLRAILVEWSGE